MRNNMLKVRKMKRLIFLLFIISLPCLVYAARDFSYTYEGQTIVYTVLDEEAKTCMTKPGERNYNSHSDNNDYYPGNKVSGTLVLPEIVSDGKTSYELTVIGSHAFFGCSDLTSVTIPNSLT